MREKLFVVLALISLFALSGCEGEEEGSSSSTETQGWHFQGRDCLACHNQDLGESKHLLFAGTLYKEDNVSKQDDEANSCGGEFVVNFLDSSFNTVYSSKNYKAEGSSGYNAKGNIFVLQRELRLLAAGIYHLQITSDTGAILAVSNYTHKFTSADYDADKSADFENRLSCNACHIKGGVTAPLYVQVNKNLCK